MNNPFSNLTIPSGLIPGLFCGSGLFAILLYVSIFNPFKNVNLGISEKVADNNCTETAFTVFLGCSENKANTEIWQCAADTSQKKEFQNNSGNCANASLALRVPKKEATQSQGLPSCQDDEYTEFIECDSSSCGYEFWGCPKTKDIKSFYNPDGDCILNGGPNNACSL